MFSNAELSHLLAQQAVDCVIILTDPSGTVLSCSPSAAEVIGVDPATMIGGHLADSYPAAERDTVKAELQQCAITGHISAAREYSNGRRTVWIEESMVALRHSDGTLAGFGRIISDASSQRRLQQRVAKANDELNQFVFTVSHDLQEPLRTVRSYSELLSRRYYDQLDSDAKDFLRFIVDGAVRITELLKDLLAYSQAGRPDRIRPESTSSGAALQWAIMNLSKDIGESGANITHNEMPTVFVDQGQFVTVFQQLIVNSIKYRGEAAPEVHVSAKLVAEDMWEFSFRDNGLGVDPQFTERVFGVFKRLVGKNVPGTGIGLSICRKIIEAHGGRMWMESEPGKGTTVKFTLPSHG